MAIAVLILIAVGAPAGVDATLNDLWFIDAATGWAVGDGGTILHTNTGGRTWTVDTVGSDAELRAVRFDDTRGGWIAGGRPGPFPPAGAGLLLRMVDRTATDRHWADVPLDECGWLDDLWSADGSKAWIAGERGSLSPAGVWSTSSTGRSWKPASRAAAGRILALDMAHFGRGVAVGSDGLILPLRRRGVAPYQPERVTRADLHAAWHRTPTQAVVVGDDATVLLEAAGGREWRRGRVDLPAGLAPLLDLRDVCFADQQHGWAVGQPAGYVLRTTDGGATWSPAPAGAELSLAGVHFVDTKTGFAVGEAGTVCRTLDGGNSWAACGPSTEVEKNFAVLVISAATETTQWPLLAHLGGVKRWRCAYVQVGADASSDGRLGTRLAARAVACSAVRVLPNLPISRTRDGDAGVDAVLAQWSAHLDRDVETEITRWLVAAIRSYRPAVVVVGDPSGESGGPESAVVARLALRAVEQASDEAAHDDLALIGLHPHSVRRTWTAQDEAYTGQGADAQLVSYLGDASALLGETSYYAAIRAMTYLAEPRDYRRPPMQAWFAMGTSPNDRQARRFCGGLGLGASYRQGPGKREFHGDVDAEQRLAELPAIQRALWAQKRLARGKVQRLLNHAADAAKQHPETIAPADVVLEAAETALDEGRTVDHQEAMRVFLQIGRRHPAWGRWALRSGARQGSTEHLLAEGNGFAGWEARRDSAGAWLNALAEQEPAVLGEPSYLAARAFISRQAGQVEESLAALHHLARRGETTDWGVFAAREAWLVRPERSDVSRPPTLTARIPAAPSEGVEIDGRLAESFWSRLPHLTLARADGGREDAALRTTARVACSEQFLYVAFVAGRYSPEEASDRRSDRGGTAATDTIEVLLDVDRDGLTAWSVGVDGLGFVDRVDDDFGWDLPASAVFASQTGEDGQGVIEMALPLKALFGGRPQPGYAVGLQLHRRVRADAARGGRPIDLWWARSADGTGGDPSAPRAFGVATFGAG